MAVLPIFLVRGVGQALGDRRPVFAVKFAVKIPVFGAVAGVCARRSLLPVKLVEEIILLCQVAVGIAFDACRAVFAVEVPVAVVFLSFDGPVGVAFDVCGTVVAVEFLVESVRFVF